MPHLITENKLIWTNIKLSILVRQEQIYLYTSDDQQLCKTSWNFFQDAVKTLSIKGYVEGHDCLEPNDPEENAIRKYYEH